MTKLEKIEQDISSLSNEDFHRLTEWIEEYKADLWDRQMEADVKAGKLDKLIAEAKADIAAGRVKPL
jgi:hypothetical protein